MRQIGGSVLAEYGGASRQVLRGSVVDLRCREAMNRHLPQAAALLMLLGAVGCAASSPGVKANSGVKSSAVTTVPADRGATSTTRDLARTSTTPASATLPAPLAGNARSDSVSSGGPAQSPVPAGGGAGVGSTTTEVASPSGTRNSVPPADRATPEQCAALRQLLAIVNDPQLHQAAVQAGCI